MENGADSQMIPPYLPWKTWWFSRAMWNDQRGTPKSWLDLSSPMAFLLVLAHPHMFSVVNSSDLVAPCPSWCCRLVSASFLSARCCLAMRCQLSRRNFLVECGSPPKNLWGLSSFSLWTSSCWGIFSDTPCCGEKRPRKPQNLVMERIIFHGLQVECASLRSHEATWIWNRSLKPLNRLEAKQSQNMGAWRTSLVDLRFATRICIIKVLLNPWWEGKTQPPTVNDEAIDDDNTLTQPSIM